MLPSPWLPIGISGIAALISCGAITLSILSYRLSKRNVTLAEPYVSGRMTSTDFGPEIAFQLAGPNREAWRLHSASVALFSANRLSRALIGDDGYVSNAIVGRSPHSERKIVDLTSTLFIEPLASLPVSVKFELRSRSNSNLRIWRTVKYTKMD